MKFGVFLPNGSNGYILSKNSPVYRPTSAHNIAISREAELLGFDFVLSMMKYRGFGGETGFWDECLESFTLMAAIAASTSRIGLFPSAAVLSLHPAVAARMVATIDDIYSGRCGLNIVTGWNKLEYVQIGLWPGDEYFRNRYDYAAEYMEVLRQLWGQASTTFAGAHFKLEDCALLPKPRHDVPIVCAGSSDAGLGFTARYGDHSFAAGTPEALRAMVEKCAAMGRAQGRRVGVYAQFTLIVADTDAEALHIAEDIVAGIDREAVANMVGSAAKDSNKGGSAERLSQSIERSLAGGVLPFMTPLIWGSPQTVVSKIEDIAAETGIEGILFSWPAYLKGVRMFGEKMLPRLCLPSPEAA